MNRFKSMSETQLRGELRRLERDVADFRERAASVAANVERLGRVAFSDPLHRRLASIHAFLSDHLIAAENEMRLRAATAVERRPSTLRSILSRLGLRGGRGAITTASG